MNTQAKAVDVNEVQYLLSSLASDAKNRSLKRAAYAMINKLEQEKLLHLKRTKSAQIDVFEVSNVNTPETEINSLDVYCMNCSEVNKVYPCFIPTFHCTCCQFENRLTKEQIDYLKSL